MRILYEKTLDGICLQRCYGLDKILEIPVTADGMPVTELAAYLFQIQSAGGNRRPVSTRESRSFAAAGWR